jgi:protein mago nashi
MKGHEYLEFELQPSGKLQYENDSGYRGGNAINKEVTISPAVVEEIRRIVLDSRITSVDDSTWERMKDRSTRRQELEIKIGNEHLAFTCPEILSLIDVQKSSDPEGLKLFYYLVQDLKCLIFSLITLHFKIKPIP